MTRKYAEGERLPVVENGCRHYEDCLSCPFDDCILGNGSRGPSPEKVKRNIEIRDMATSGAKPADIALTFGISRRTAYRVLKE